MSLMTHKFQEQIRVFESPCSKPLMFQHSISVAPEWTSVHLNVTFLDWLFPLALHALCPFCLLPLFLHDLPMICNYFIGYLFVCSLSSFMEPRTFSYWFPSLSSSEWLWALRSSAIKMCWVIGCTANHACQLGENESQGKANVQIGLRQRSKKAF